MKQKTSITLSEDLISALEKEAMKGENRSEQIERLLRERLKEKAREEREQRDLELINEHADRLNKEAGEVLEFQVEL